MLYAQKNLHKHNNAVYKTGFSFEVKFESHKGQLPYFSITGNEYEDGKIVSCGCLHEDFKRLYPEYAHLLKWHLCALDGPMHYLANTIYHASDKDCFGGRKGEIKSWSNAVIFGNSPIAHKVEKSFSEFLQARVSENRLEFEILEISYPGKYDTLKSASKFTFDGYTEKWHLCPFNTRQEAEQWQDALLNLPIEFLRIPASFHEGKDRDFDAARNSAIWQDATNEELSLPEDDLKQLLINRLPALMNQFADEVNEFFGETIIKTSEVA